MSATPMKRARAAVEQGDAGVLRAILREERELVKKPQPLLDACKSADLALKPKMLAILKEG